jgi:acyl-CoA reductase-like NAD-dependent aldehyde dehydrogenase
MGVNVEKAKAKPDPSSALPAEVEGVVEAAKSEIDEGPASVADDDDDLSTVSNFPAFVRIGSGEAAIAALAHEAKVESGLTASKWNALDQNKRTAHMQKTLDRLRKEQEEHDAEFIAAAGAGTAVEQGDVRVHETRGIGGRYVALGGGERVRVAEASTASDALVIDDDELAAQAGE